MTKIVLHRLLSLVPVLLVVSWLAFFLLNASPSNIVSSILGDTATDESIAQTKEKLGLDQGVWARYFDWLSAVVRGDFGSSYLDGSGVWTSVMDRLPVTLSLTLGD